MKVMSLALAAGTCLMFAAGSASASFLGIDVVKMNDFMGNLGDQEEPLPGNFGKTAGAHPLVALHSAHADSGLSTYRIYAMFDGPTRVASVGTVTTGPGFMTAKSGTFWHAPQEDYYGETLPPRLLAPTSPFPTPLHVADTYITVGQFANPDTAIAGPWATQTQNMGDGQSSFSWSNSGAFIFGGNASLGDAKLDNQGIVDDGIYRTLIFQISVLEDGTGKAGIEGNIGHIGTIVDGIGVSIFNDNGQLEFSSGQQQLPAPGALALLGLAGLAGARRRRD